MTDVNGVLQIEMRRHSREVICVVIHVMAISRLAGAPMTAAIMGDDAIAVIEEEQHLRIPVIGRQRPAVREHHRLPLAPVLVVDLDAVLGLDRRHAEVSSLWMPSFRDTPRSLWAGRRTDPLMTSRNFEIQARLIRKILGRPK